MIPQFSTVLLKCYQNHVVTVSQPDWLLISTFYLANPLLPTTWLPAPSCPRHSVACLTLCSSCSEGLGEQRQVLLGLHRGGGAWGELGGLTKRILKNAHFTSSQKSMAPVTQALSHTDPKYLSPYFPPCTLFYFAIPQTNENE